MRLFLHELAQQAAALYGSRNLIESDLGSLSFNELPMRGERLASILADAAPEHDPGSIIWLRTSSHAMALTGAIASSLAGFAAVIADSWLGEKVGVKPLLIVSDDGVQQPPQTEAAPLDLTSPARRAWIGSAISSDPVIGFFTSGSSGTTKLVIGSHDAVLSVTESITRYLQIEPDDVVVTASPPQFDYGFYQTLLALNTGARVLACSDIIALEHEIRVHSATVLALTPTSLRAICLNPRSQGSAKVRLIVSTGSPFPVEHVGDLARLYPAASLVPMYGLTECKRALYGRIASDDEGRAVEVLDRPIPNLRASFTDEGELEVMPGHAMTILSDGPGVITTDQFGRQTLRTGDFFIFDERFDGYRYVGRRDDIVKIGDRRLSAIAVEHELREANPDREIAVIGLPDADGTTKLAALIEGRAAIIDRAPTPLVRSWLHVAELPRLSNGKLDRRKARRLLELVPTRGAFLLDDGDIRPWTEPHLEDVSPSD